MPGEEGALALAGQEAEVLALALGGDRQARLGGQLAHLGFVRSASGKRSRESDSRPQRGEHVGLVLGGVGRRGEQRPCAVVGEAGVVAGGERRRPEPPARASIASIRSSPLQSTQGFGVRPASCPRTKPSTTVARKASSRSSVRCGAHPMGQRPGADDRLGRAAASRPVGVPVGPQLQRHRDDLGAALALEQRGDGGVDPAAHRDEHALAGRRRGGEHLARRGRGAERAVERVGGQFGGVAALRREPAQLRGDRRPDSRRLEHARCPRPPRRPRRRPRRRRATLGVEARRDHATPSTRARRGRGRRRGAPGGAAEGAVGAPGRAASHRSGNARRPRGSLRRLADG